MCARTFLLFFFLGWLTKPVYADEPQKFTPIDAETIATYKTLGAKCGGFPGKSTKFWPFCFEPDATVEGLPAFKFDALVDGRLPKLPAVRVPFGLDLSETLVTDLDLKELNHLNNLIFLNLSHTQVTDKGLKEFTHLKNLRALDLSDTWVTDEGLKEIKHLQHLTTLNLSETNITDLGLKKLKHCKRLTALYLDSKQLTDVSLRILRKRQLLHAISTVSGTKGTLPKSADEVKWLTFSATQITDVGLKELNDFKNLSTLFLCRTKVTNVGLKELKHLRNLTELYLDGTEVSDAGLKDLKCLASLVNLDLAGTKVTDLGLKELKSLKNLKYLNVAGTEVTDAGLTQLKQALPKCKIISCCAIFNPRSHGPPWERTAGTLRVTFIHKNLSSWPQCRTFY